MSERFWRTAILFLCAAAVALAAAAGPVDDRLRQIVQRHVTVPYPDPAAPDADTRCWGLAAYALACLHLSSDVVKANETIHTLHQEYNVPDSGTIDFPLYFKLHLLWRIRCDRNMNARLRPAVRGELEDMMWRWVNPRSRVADATGSVWRLAVDEHHNAMQKASHLLCAQTLAAAGTPYGPDRLLEDGKSLREHAAAWSAYWEEYFRQRARAGVQCQIASPPHAPYNVGSYINVFDFAESARVRVLAERFLSLYWADTACDFVASGVRGGAQTRCYKNTALFRGRSYGFIPLLWAYGWHAGFDGKNTAPLTLLAATSNYRVPPVITACAADRNRPEYLYTSRRFGRGGDADSERVHTVTFDRDQASHLRRDTYVTPDYAMGTLTLDPTQDYLQLIDQDRVMGVAFSSAADDRVMVFGKGAGGDLSTGYRELNGVCAANAMVVCRDANAKPGTTLCVFVAKGTLWDGRATEGGWLFTRTGTACCAVRPAVGAYTVELVTDGAILTPAEPGVPIVIQMGRGRDMARSFAEFRRKVTALPRVATEATVTYTSLAGDTFVVSRAGTSVPVLNGRPVDLNPAKTYDSPYLNMTHGQAVATFRYRGFPELKLDFGGADPRP